MERRNEDYRRIMQELRFRKSGEGIRRTEYGLAVRSATDERWAQRSLCDALCDADSLSSQKSTARVCLVLVKRASLKPHSPPPPARPLRATPLCSHVIFFGDFNYRLTGSRHRVYDLLRDGDLVTLYELDQLKKERAANRVFRNFEEGPITFFPTYKLDTGTLRYDTRSVRVRVRTCDRE